MQVFLYELQTNGKKETPLHLASEFNNITIVKMLVRYGMDKGICFEVRNKLDMTPLQVALLNGYDDIVLFLLNQGTNARLLISVLVKIY